jgi:hypothetical protein
MLLAPLAEEKLSEVSEEEDTCEEQNVTLALLA